MSSKAESAASDLSLNSKLKEHSISSSKSPGRASSYNTLTNDSANSLYSSGIVMTLKAFLLLEVAEDFQLSIASSTADPANSPDFTNSTKYGNNNLTIIII